MKAIILAGGKGTRAKPYTDYFPKAMIPICGTPLIQHIVKYINSHSFVKEIIIISDFEGLGAQIRNHLSGQKFSKKIKFIQDSQNGTGGDLLHAADSLKDTKGFILWFVDNFCAVDLNEMKKEFDSKSSMACIATRSKRKEETGFATVKDGIITGSKEKPTIKLHMQECLGIYMLNTKILKQIKHVPKKDINLSYDVLEELSKRSAISAYDIGSKEWLDIESPIIVERNKSQINKIIKQMEF